jgi:WD40 repeat protein
MTQHLPLVIEPTHCRPAREFKHASPLIGCRFDPTGRFLFASAQDNTLQRFDLFTGKTASFVGHKSWVRGMAFLTPQYSAVAPETFPALDALGGGSASLFPPPPPITPFTLVTGDYHGNLLWWPGSTDNPTPIRTVEAHHGWVRAVVASPDSQTLATCGNDHLVKLWDAADGKPIRTLEGHDCHVYNVAFHPESDHVVSADLMGAVKDWDCKKGQLVRELDAKVLHKYDTTFRADIGGIRGMGFSADGTWLACAGITNVSNAFAGVGNPLVVLFDWKEGKAKQQLKPAAAFQGTAWGVACHRQGFIVGAGGGNGGQIWFWRPDAAASFHTFTLPQSARDMALHPAGHLVAVACADGVARLYSLTAKLPEPPKPPAPPMKK